MWRLENTLLEPAVDGEKSERGKRPPTILIIDDDVHFRALARAFLKDTSYRILEAADGVEGLALIASQRVDAMVTDLVMPEQEGLSTIRQARQMFPGLKILAVSGVGARSVYLRSAEFFGAHASLEKPITRESLLEALRRVLPAS